MKRRQKGITSVEFAVIGSVLYMMLFGVIEFGRLMYTFAVLDEGTRRAARLAAVCPIGAFTIRTTVDFAGLPRFNPGNVRVRYLDENGNATANYAAINFVQVQIGDYFIPLTIPFINPTITAPSFTVTLPRESLGVSSTAVGFCG